VEVQAKCHKDDKILHWKVFNDRVLKPVMENTRAPSLTEICYKYGIENEKKASNMIVTVNRRFRAALKRHLRRSVSRDVEVDEELQELMQILSKKGAV